MKESQRKGLISVHVAVALFGFVGLFAKLVDLPAVIIVLGRVFFSSIFLWIFLRFKKQKIRLEEKSDYLWMVGAGAPNIVCTQPFACLPNHVVGKGVIKELRRRHPESNIVAIDYDPGASEVNQLNRIKLMLSTAQKKM